VENRIKFDPETHPATNREGFVEKSLVVQNDRQTRSVSVASNRPSTGLESHAFADDFPIEKFKHQQGITISSLDSIEMSS